ncbi:hypothetical protein EAI_17485 [Harpegnathos saltator]|uniref:Uncharacterized protein n=1 Tax=Harpegnathos saltator TaxID=610380 RepID=E2C3N3_HARSA|nr:hypothetical protein EAI_17485 [Harpegnathos saltator]
MTRKTGRDKDTRRDTRISLAPTEELSQPLEEQPPAPVESGKSLPEWSGMPLIRRYLVLARPPSRATTKVARILWGDAPPPRPRGCRRLELPNPKVKITGHLFYGDKPKPD